MSRRIQFKVCTFHFTVCDGFLYARMKLLTFTMNKRRAGSLARKQRTPLMSGLGGLADKVFPRGCRLFTLRFTSGFFERTGLQFPFLIRVTTICDTRYTNAMLFAFLISDESVQNAGNVGTFFQCSFYQFSVVWLKTFLFSLRKKRIN